MQTSPDKKIPRPPIVAVMGHIDHGKSTLLDYIRKANTVEAEAGGITQRLSAYEVEHEHEGTKKKVTFLDTPGHESFVAMRARGARVADVAILVVSAEEGVKPQTLEAKKSIDESGIPFIVAITKIDRPEANVERTKASIIESGIYLEKLGGDIPYVPVSAKSGEGVPELLDTVLLVADLAELTGNPSAPATGFVIESSRDPKKGVAATLVITDGTLTSGSFVVADSAYSPVRIFEDFLGNPIKSASFSSPVLVIGWSDLPEAGALFTTVDSKREAEKLATEAASASAVPADDEAQPADDIFSLPLIIKADVAGSIEAIEHEIAKIPQERIRVKIVHTGVGSVSENDIKTSLSNPATVVIGFNVPVDGPAQDLADRSLVSVERFDIIYKLTEYLEALMKERAPKEKIDEPTGTAKVLKTFSKSGEKQVLGGRTTAGAIAVGEQVKIIRHDLEIGRGSVLNLQQQKADVKKVSEGSEFGAEIKSKAEIAPGDFIQAFTTVER